MEKKALLQTNEPAKKEDDLKLEVRKLKQVRTGVKAGLTCWSRLA